jgi:uncharacterized protein YjbJ (UPF0337 family)
MPEIQREMIKENTRKWKGKREETQREMRGNAKENARKCKGKCKEMQGEMRENASKNARNRKGKCKEMQGKMRGIAARRGFYAIHQHHHLYQDLHHNPIYHLIFITISSSSHYHDPHHDRLFFNNISSPQ